MITRQKISILILLGCLVTLLVMKCGPSRPLEIADMEEALALGALEEAARQLDSDPRNLLLLTLQPGSFGMLPLMSPELLQKVETKAHSLKVELQVQALPTQDDFEGDGKLISKAAYIQALEEAAPGSVVLCFFPPPQLGPGEGFPSSISRMVIATTMELPAGEFAPASCKVTRILPRETAGEKGRLFERFFKMD